MSYTRYKRYAIVDNGTVQYLQTSDGCFLYSTELIDGYIPQDEIDAAVRSPISKKYIKVFLLREDETIFKDITPWVQLSGNIEKKNASGQTRSTNLTLRNEEINGKYLWTPSPNGGGLWDYQKIKIVSGIVLPDRLYEVSEGIFVIHDPSLTINGAQHTVTLQCYDKFALLDGTIDGIGDLDTEVPRGSNLRAALASLLKLNRSIGVPFDLKDISFPNKYKNELTPYTLKKTADNSIGSIISDLVLMISCDVKYDDDGRMEVFDTLADLDYHNRRVSWNYKDGEFLNPTIKLNRSKIKNKVTVVGANINGRLVKGVAENTNPLSNYNINSSFGIKATKITDDLLYSEYLCKERARYELKKSMQEYATVTMQSIYIPHLEPGDIVRWTYEPWEIEQEEFLVNSVSVPQHGKDLMSITMTNLKELPL